MKNVRRAMEPNLAFQDELDKAISWQLQDDIFDLWENELYTIMEDLKEMMCRADKWLT